jgi:hypothetical protein
LVVALTIGHGGRDGSSRPAQRRSRGRGGGEVGAGTSVAGWVSVGARATELEKKVAHALTGVSRRTCWGNGLRNRYATSGPVADFGPRVTTGFC